MKVREWVKAIDRNQTITIKATNGMTILTGNSSDVDRYAAGWKNNLFVAAFKAIGANRLELIIDTERPARRIVSITRRSLILV